MDEAINKDIHKMKLENLTSICEKEKKKNSEFSYI